MLSDLEILENAHFNVQQSMKVLARDIGGFEKEAVRVSLTVAERQLEEIIQRMTLKEIETSLWTIHGS